MENLTKISVMINVYYELVVTIRISEIVCLNNNAR